MTCTERRVFQMDVGTIGSTPAEILLNKILIELKNPKLIHRLMSIYMDIKEVVRGLKSVSDPKFKRRTYNLYKNQFASKAANINCEELKDDPNFKYVKSLFLNCVTTQFKFAYQSLFVTKQYKLISKDEYFEYKVEAETPTEAAQQMHEEYEKIYGPTVVVHWYVQEVGTPKTYEQIKSYAKRNLGRT